MSQTVTIDARRLLCPMPVIKTQKIVRQLQTGDIVLLRATDRGVIHDVPAWCRMYGHDVVSIDTREDEVEITIKVCRDD